MQKKLSCRSEFSSIWARNMLKPRKVKTSMIKCAHRFNHHGLRYSIINDNMVDAHCPRCNSVETWDHIAKCKDIIDSRKKFTEELIIKLLRNKSENMDMSIIVDLAENNLRCLEKEEDEEKNNYLIRSECKISF